MVFQPGERVSCTGCHDDPLSAPPPRIDPLNPTLALRRAPSRLGGWHGPPRPFSYMAEVQPVWDRHCVSCHDFGKPAGAKLNLAGDRDLFFNASYEALHQRRNRPDGYLRTAVLGRSATRQPGDWGRVPARGRTSLEGLYHDVAFR